jgi:molybdopterin-containing oxidoreductase family membrane subunit
VSEAEERREERVKETPPAGILAPGHSYASVTDKISAIVLKRGVKNGWLAGFAVSSVMLFALFWGVAVLFKEGIGVWGVNIPVAWGFAITNFVWWIGIGHAGTLISAILLLLNQKWRTSINRFAEAMTLFAVACAGLFPLLHLGRPSLFYWLLPYPDTMGLWPQFRSPLVWDVFAVSTYFTVSLIFWYIGLVPDLATLRDRAAHWLPRRVFGFFSLGWRNSVTHWRRYEIAYLLLAGLATPLVISVHSVVSLDFTAAIVPGWHSTIFPPYFVAGAIFSGFAMVLVIAIPLRWAYGLHDFVTDKHLDHMAKLMLATGLVVGYGYLMEWFMGVYGGDLYDQQMLHWRFHGPYAPAGWAMIFCNVVAPQILWWKPARRSIPVLFASSVVVLIGMWLERFVIVVQSLSRDFLPSSWGMYYPTRWDWAILFGSFGLFSTCMFLFIRLLPMISISEMRGLVAEEEAA